jgi:hypothetical protein
MEPHPLYSSSSFKLATSEIKKRRNGLLLLLGMCFSVKLMPEFILIRVLEFMIKKVLAPYM